MKLTNTEIHNRINDWLNSWNNHHLQDVLELIHDDVVFENWKGAPVIGKSHLRQSWLPWFINHGNFKFTVEDIFADEQEQKALFLWQLEWPSLESSFKGKRELRRGADVLHFLEGKISKKYTYSKTSVVIDGQSVELIAKV